MKWPKNARCNCKLLFTDRTVSSDWIKRCKFLRIETQPRKRSNGLSSGPGISFCGCGHGRHNVSSASCVNSVGTAPAHERAGITREICGALPVNSYRITINHWDCGWAVILEKRKLIHTLRLYFVFRALSWPWWWPRWARPIGCSRRHCRKWAAIRMWLHVR